MGALKQLLPFRGSTIAEAAVGSALEAGCRAILVVGHRGDELAARFGAPAYREAIAEGRLLLVDNPRWGEGLLGSIQAALPAVATEAFFVAHADMPFLPAAAYLALAEARDSAPSSAVFGSCGGRRGHPALLPSAWIPQLLALDPGGALRDFVSARPALLVETGPGSLRDIDTPEDYEAALSGRLPPARIDDTQT
jgi:molybdenum cofactor cytidylyltransferase